MNRSVVLEGFSLVVLVALTVAFFNLLRPFLVDILLAAVLAIMLFGIYSFLSEKVRLRGGVASFLVVFMVFCVIVGIVTFLGIVLGNEANAGYQALRQRWPAIAARLAQIDVRAAIARIPFLGEQLSQMEVSRLSQVVERLLTEGSGLIVSLAQRSFSSLPRAVGHFALVMVLTFFLLKRGQELWGAIEAIIPLDRVETEELSSEIVGLTRATMKSTLFIGLIEGIYGGLIFFIFGLPSPVVWGVLIMILSVIPLVGTNLIIVPAGVITVIAGRFAAGIGIIVLGLVGVALTQNILRPRILAGRSGLHPAVVLLATLGGLAWLGIIGFLVGPVLASLFVVAWRQFGKRYEAAVARSSTQDPV